MLLLTPPTLGCSAPRLNFWATSGGGRFWSPCVLQKLCAVRIRIIGRLAQGASLFVAAADYSHKGPEVIRREGFDRKAECSACRVFIENSLYVRKRVGHKAAIGAMGNRQPWQILKGENWTSLLKSGLQADDVSPRNLVSTSSNSNRNCNSNSKSSSNSNSNSNSDSNSNRNNNRGTNTNANICHQAQWRRTAARLCTVQGEEHDSGKNEKRNELCGYWKIMHAG